jgi:DNA repair protein RecO (recombination protein O)
VAPRYSTTEGIVIRRQPLPSGDVIATILSEHIKWRGIARKGKLPGGNLGRLSLFHDVTVQSYRRREEDLAVLTQVQLNGALPNLSRPEVYPQAHLLAELADSLTVDIQLGERIYHYLASGLRGLNHSDDPVRIGIIFSWRLLQAAGIAPRVKRCTRCDAAPPLHFFDISGGGVTCQACRIGIPIPIVVGDDLRAILIGTIKSSLQRPFPQRRAHQALLQQYCTYHVEHLRSFNAGNRTINRPGPQDV